MIFFNAYGALRYWAAQIPAALIAALVFRFTYAEEEYESIDWDDQDDDKKAPADAKPDDKKEDAWSDPDKSLVGVLPPGDPEAPPAEDEFKSTAGD